MPFFKLRHRTKSSPAPTVSISKPLPSSSDSNLALSPELSPPPNSMDNANRGTPPTPLRLRGNYQAVNTAAPLRRIPSSPLPSLPSYESGDDLGSPNARPSLHRDGRPHNPTPAPATIVTYCLIILIAVARVASPVVIVPFS